MSVLDIYLQQLQVDSMQTCFVSYSALSGQPHRAVAVCPAFVICKRCVLDPVSRDTIHLNSLQCCDLHVDAMIPWPVLTAGQGSLAGLLLSALPL